MPSSFAALLHGTLDAVGMWPARCACSCGRWAGASSRPAYSSGLRTSTRFWVPIAATTSSRNARIEWSCSWAVYWRGGAVRQLLGQLAGVELPLLAAAVEQLDVLVAVQLEVPVGVRGEPVVVAAVEDDGVVVADAALGEQRLELLLVDEVAADLVLQVGRPVELDGALDVALVVGVVSSSTSIRTIWSLSRFCSTQSAETSAVSRLMVVVPFSWLRPGGPRVVEVVRRRARR